VKPSPGVLKLSEHGRTVLLDTHGGTFFGLNELGSKIWTAIEQRKPFEEIVRELEDVYDVDGQSLRTDAIRFVESLRELKLVTDG
jgi:hypothetical protein